MTQSDAVGGSAQAGTANTEGTADQADTADTADQADATGTAGTPPSATTATSTVVGAPSPRRTGPSIRPALIVVGIALLLILVFGVASALTSNPTPKAPKPAAVEGTGLVAEPATATLHPIEILGTPPADVLDALVLPKGAHEVSDTPWSGSTQYAGDMSFRLGAAQATLVDFFHTEFHAHGWSIVSVGAAHDDPHATEVLAQRASTDGWFWEAGVVVYPTTFGHAGADVTRFELELYEMPDAT
jgi:hypothetical protein